MRKIADSGNAVQRAIERLGGSEIAAERLFDDDASARHTAGVAQAPDDRAKNSAV